MPTGILVFLSDVSGNMPTYTPVGETIVNTSGQIIGIGQGGNQANVTVEGSLQTTDQASSQFIPGSLTYIPASSGGVRLENVAVNRAVVRAMPNNSGYIFLGSETFPPFSGFGFVLTPGDAFSATVNNFSVFRAFATWSGDAVTYAGTAL